MVQMIFRNFVTLIIIGGLVGGAGIAIIADSFVNPSILTSEITDVDGNVTKLYTPNNLDNNGMFKIWLGAAIGYGASVVGVLYKARKGNGEEA